MDMTTSFRRPLLHPLLLPLCNCAGWGWGGAGVGRQMDRRQSFLVTLATVPATVQGLRSAFAWASLVTQTTATSF